MMPSTDPVEDDLEQRKQHIRELREELAEARQKLEEAEGKRREADDEARRRHREGHAENHVNKALSTLRHAEKRADFAREEVEELEEKLATAEEKLAEQLADTSTGRLNEEAHEAGQQVEEALIEAIIGALQDVAEEYEDVLAVHHRLLRALGYKAAAEARLDCERDWKRTRTTLQRAETRTYLSPQHRDGQDLQALYEKLGLDPEDHRRAHRAFRTLMQALGPAEHILRELADENVEDVAVLPLSDPKDVWERLVPGPTPVQREDDKAADGDAEDE